jgi:hypothetical protein
MKKTPPDSVPTSDDMRPEYRFDYGKARPNRFADPEQSRRTVVLDEDIAEVFTTSEAVNRALRALLDVVPVTARRSG